MSTLESHTDFKEKETDYWAQRHYYQMCRADPDAKWSDLRDCADAIDRAYTEWCKVYVRLSAAFNKKGATMASARAFISQLIEYTEFAHRRS